MSKKRQETQTSSPAPEAKAKPKPKPKQVNPAMPWHWSWRLLVSLLVVFHLAAIVSAPWCLPVGDALPPGYVAPQGQPNIPPPESAVWQKPVVPQALHKFFTPYLNLTYMNHGYEFFAPDPGASHLIRYSVASPSGQSIEGEFPNLEQQWPRLFYHRHMMLAAQTLGLGEASGQHFADHLATVHGGPSEVRLLIHLLLDPQRVAEGTPLNAPSTYREIARVRGRPRPQQLPQPEQPVALPEVRQ